MASTLMGQSIFGDQPDNVEGECNYGFVIGGMAVNDERRIARSYKLAAEMLVAEALRTGDQTWEVSYPIAFLYRHALELHLKLVVPATHHRLSELIQQANAVAVQKTGNPFPQDALDRLNEFAAIDPGSMTFRYADLRAARALTGRNEAWVDLHHLREIMDVLLAGLRKLSQMQKFATALNGIRARPSVPAPPAGNGRLGVR